MLTENSMKIHKQADALSLPVKASTKLFGMGMVCTDATGYAVKADDAANYVFMGVAVAEADNSSGSSGDVNVLVKRNIVIPCKTTGATQASVGKVAYVTDDETVALTAPTNAVRCGVVVGYISATEVLVKID